MIPNKLYDVLKYLAVVGLPAFAAFWMLVGALWHVPHTDEIVKTVVAVGVLLGALITVSSVRYNSSDAKYDGVIDPLAANRQTSDTALNLGNVGAFDASMKKDLLLKVQSRDPGDVLRE